MCNNYERRIGYAEYQRALREFGLTTASAQGEHDLPPADDVQIGDIAPMMRLAGEAVELAPMRFGFPPPRPKAEPVFNFRSEGGGLIKANATSSRPARSSSSPDKISEGQTPLHVGRCAVPGIVRLWRPGQGNQLAVEPGADVVLPGSEGRRSSI